MDHPPRTGRPAKPRDPIAGERLRQALRILGKTWRKNTGDPDHVLNWPAWAACGLPRSATTIDADIRLGVPEERMAAYARCLGLPPRALGEPETDMRDALGAARQDRAGAATPLALGFGPAFESDYLVYNASPYIRDLFALMGGVYRVHYALTATSELHRCAYWLHAAEAHRLLGRGLFMMFGLENLFSANIFRWHNNLHTHYLCHTGKELGHYLSVDPLRHNLVARRDPFWLKGQGVTDRGLADNAPVCFTFRMEKLPLPDGRGPEALWEEECDALRARPAILPGESDYDALRDAVLVPDTLL